MDGATRRARLATARLYLIVTPRAAPIDVWERLETALRSGAIDLAQLRLPGATDAELHTAAQRLRALCRAADVLCVLNDRADLAAALEFDGAHVGQADTAPALARRLLGPDRLLGLSTHGPSELEAARSLALDYVGLGPCFATSSKRLDRAPGGAELVRRSLASAGDLPLFPIGGITAANAPALIAAGAARLAVGAGILDAPDPGLAAQELRGALERAQASE